MGHGGMEPSVANCQDQERVSVCLNTGEIQSYLRGMRRYKWVSQNIYGAVFGEHLRLGLRNAPEKQGFRADFKRLGRTDGGRGHV